MDRRFAFYTELRQVLANQAEFFIQLVGLGVVFRVLGGGAFAFAGQPLGLYRQAINRTFRLAGNLTQPLGNSRVRTLAARAFDARLPQWRQSPFSPHQASSAACNASVLAAGTGLQPAVCSPMRAAASDQLRAAMTALRSRFDFRPAFLEGLDLILLINSFACLPVSL
jgi:hypothetical protein